MRCRRRQSACCSCFGAVRPTRSCRDRSTRPGSSRPSRSCRIRPIAPCSSSSQQTRAHPRGAQRHRSRDRFSQPDRASSCCGEQGPARSRVRARLRLERPLLRQLHEHGGRHGHRAIHALVAIRSSPIRRRDSICSSRGRGASSRSRLRITTADTWRSGPTAISTSASATAARATTPTTARRIRASCSARCCASTSTSPTPTPSATGFHPTIRFVGAEQRARRNLGVRPAQSVAVQLRRCRARRHGRAGHRRRRSEPAGRNQLRAARRRRPQLRLAQSRRHARQRHVASAAYQPPTDPIFEYGRSDGVSVTGGFVYRGARLGPPIAAGISSPTTRAASGRSRSRSMASGEARASDRREHTAELGGSAVLGQHQLVRRRRRRRALRRQSFRRQNRPHHRAALPRRPRRRA